MGRKEDLMNDAVAAYEQSTGDVPDTRDYVAMEDAVNDYIAQEEGA